MTLYAHVARAVRRHFECETCMVIAVLLIAAIGCVVGAFLD